MRLRHAKQAAIGLPTDEPGRVRAKSAIVAEAERLRRRTWNGKAKNARRSIERIRKLMQVFKDKRGHRTTGAPPGRLWAALREVDRHLNSQGDWLVNYAALINQRQRRRSGPGCRLARSDAIGGRPLI
jgi:hypothetical protein